MKFENHYFEEGQKYKLFVDMDDVIVDFIGGFGLLGLGTPEDYERKEGVATFWKAINDGGVDFWSNLPWKKDGKELWEYVKKHDPTILTTPSRKEDSKIGKRIWVDREIGKDQEMVFAKNKFEHAKPNYILIDDYDRKIIPWREAGGIGILHTSTKDTIEQLKKLGI